MAQIGGGGGNLIIVNADLPIRNDYSIVPSAQPREGWADDARRIADQRDDALAWPAFANAGDSDLVW